MISLDLLQEDLDNYNRNTREGIHTTSIAAAWMNIIYGFGGLRTDGDIILLHLQFHKTGISTLSKSIIWEKLLK